MTFPHPDVMTNAQHMLWMLDEFEVIHGGKHPGFITGKPVGMGGSLGRTEATGYGVIYTVREALKNLGIKIEDTTASFQGFGNVSQYALAALYTSSAEKQFAFPAGTRKTRLPTHSEKESGISLKN